MTNENDIDHFINTDGLDTEREQTIGQHIGYRYDVNLVPDYDRITPFLQEYLDTMGWQDLNWLEDVHMGYEDGRPAVFDRNINGWVSIPEDMELPDNQQYRDMIAPTVVRLRSNTPTTQDIKCARRPISGAVKR